MSLSHTYVCPTPGVVHEPPIELHTGGPEAHPGGLHHQPPVTGADIQQGALTEKQSIRIDLDLPRSHGRSLMT